MQILEGTHRETVMAEAALKRRYREAVLLRSQPMPSTFGAGTEVLPISIYLDLAEVLKGHVVKFRLT